MPYTGHTSTELQGNVKSPAIDISDELSSIIRRWQKYPGNLAIVDDAVMASVRQYPHDEWSALANFYKEVER